MPRKTLAEPLTSSATSFRLNNIKKWDGTDLTASDFGTDAYGAIRDAKGTVVEFFAFDPATIADADIDFTYRGLSYNGTNLTTEIAGNKLEWGKGSIVELGTHGPQIFQWLQELIEGIAIAGAPDATTTLQGLSELATAAEITSGTATGGTGAPLTVTPDALEDSKYGQQIPTASQKAGLAGDASPSASNPYTTRNRTMKAGETISGATTPVPVFQNKTDNEYYICDGNDTAKMKFLGFALTNANNGEDIEVQFSGIVSGFTGLSEGEKYYLSDTAGAISTTIGTYEVLVGIAISETQLLIQKGRRYATGVIMPLTSPTVTTITCGFRPSVVRIYASAQDQGLNIVSTLYTVWHKTGHTSLSAYFNDGGDAVVVNESRLYRSYSGSDYCVINVQDVTDTSFDIYTGFVSSYSVDSDGLIWEAEGEL